jgi:hypothetical protein
MKLIEICTDVENFPLTEMANLRPDETGLNYIIWIGRIGGQHGPRVKVSNIKGKWRENNNFVLSIDHTEPKEKSKPETIKIPNEDVKQVKKWITSNYDDLMLLWWMFERNASHVKDEDTGIMLSMDDIFDRLQKV